MSKLLDYFGQKFTAFGALATAVVGLNSALTSCSTQTVNRYASFRAAVTGEENFWKDRLTEYTSIMNLKDEAERRRKLWALAALSQHDVPDFQEYRFGLFDDQQSIRAAQFRLQGMRDTLNKALQNKESSDLEVAAAVKQSVVFDQAQKNILMADQVQRTDTAPSPKPISTPQSTISPSDEINFGSQILLRGRPNGWDIDFFWCAGGGPESDSSNYSIARSLALKLATIGSQNGQLAASIQLGQIRLAPLPSLKQGGNNPVLGSGNSVKADADEAEQDVANALVRQFSDVKPRFSVNINYEKSQWYLSTFVCNTKSKN